MAGDGWSTMRFDQCADLVRDTVHPSDVRDLPYIGLEHIAEGKLALTSYGSVEQVTSVKSRFREGDILFGKLRPYFRKVVIAPFDGVCSTDIWVVRRKQGIDQRYLFYWMASHEFIEESTRASEGTRMPRAQWEFVGRIEKPVPPLKEQQAIACILGALDDKIELNRRMSRTLEEMARALFKSWFVDFEMVRYKAAGQPPPGLAPDIAALFPDSFEDSELGEIPKGWNITTLGKICELAYGKGLKTSERRPGKVPVMGSNGQVGWHDEALVRGPGIIVGRKGNPGIVTWIQSDFFPIDTTFYVNTKIDHVPLTYLFFALKYLNLQNLGADSAVPGLNRNIAYMSKLLLPFPYILDNFNKITFVLFEKIYKSDQLNIDLINLRDALLPKLISGELRVPDAERIVGRCT